ncbi:MAG: hypothetical protein HOW73_08505 [Polyangiaceae bacterium]|nr:hypothetical protein [Polyangiaceae bacterium]
MSGSQTGVLSTGADRGGGGAAAFACGAAMGVGSVGGTGATAVEQPAIELAAASHNRIGHFRWVPRGNMMGKAMAPGRIAVEDDAGQVHRVAPKD